MPTPREEIVQIVDRRNQEAGAVPRSTMRREVLTHRASYILVFNSREELFLQKRTASNPLPPFISDRSML